MFDLAVNSKHAVRRLDSFTGMMKLVVVVMIVMIVMMMVVLVMLAIKFINDDLIRRYCPTIVPRRCSDSCLPVDLQM